MPVIAIINRKGGCGKSTLATHVAAWLSLRGERVMLGDVDRQQSTRQWLRRRQALAGAVQGEALDTWAIDAQRVMRPPLGVRHAVLDTPGGLHGLDLNRLLGYADVVLVPVCDSLFDRESAAACLAELQAHPRVASGRTRLGVVGMRMDGRRQSERRLRDWADGLGLPFLGGLRLNQAYVHAADQGLTVFDLPAERVQPDLAQWRPIQSWLQSALGAAEMPLTAAVRTARSPDRAAAKPAPHPAVTAMPASAGVVPARIGAAPPLSGRSAPLSIAVTARKGLRGWLGWLLPRDARARSELAQARPGA